MDAMTTTREVDIILTKISLLYPDFTVAGFTTDGQDYIIDINYDENIPGTALVQRWRVEDGKAVFIQALPKS